MNRRFALLLFVGLGCAPGTGANGLRCVSRDAIDPMKRQQRYDPYSENTFFSDRRAMRLPPPGAIPRVLPLASDPVATGMSDGGTVARIPIPLSRELFVLGKKQFEIVCAACHGIAGDGDSVVARQMQLRPPPSLLEARLRALSDGALFRVVTEGYGMMPSYRNELEPNERWAVVAYVRALQRSQSVSIADAPADVARKIPGGGP
jgi:mono/diheme cytochrome c family protein